MIVERDRREVTRDGLVVLLTLVTGAVDAACFLHLGHVFSSVVTGTMVLLGVAAGTRDPDLALHCGVALVGYIAGVLISAPVVARPAGQRTVTPAARQATWPPSVTFTLAAEFCVLAVFSAGWELAGGHPAETGQLVLLAMLAVAMGMQGAAVRQLGEMSSTYLTGTLTGVVAGLATRKRPAGLGRSLGAFAAVVAGAFISAIVTASAPAWLPAVILSPLGIVVASSAARFGVLAHLTRRRERPGSSDGPATAPRDAPADGQQVKDPPDRP